MPKTFHPGLPSEKTLALVDLFLFLVDARIPQTSIELARPFLLKKRVVYVLTKEDLADPSLTLVWKRQLSKDRPAFVVNAKNGKGVSAILAYLKEEYVRVNAKRREGVLERPIRLMLFGLPNVGKSSLANRLLGIKKAPFGAKPGLTRASSWLRGRNFLDILDTPGVVDTSKVKGETRLKLAAVWAIPDNAFDNEEVAHYLSKIIWKDDDPAKAIELYSVTHGAVGANGLPDIERGCKMLLSSFRQGEVGRFTLEEPDPDRKL